MIPTPCSPQALGSALASLAPTTQGQGGGLQPGGCLSLFPESTIKAVLWQQCPLCPSPTLALLDVTAALPGLLPASAPPVHPPHNSPNQLLEHSLTPALLKPSWASSPSGGPGLHSPVCKAPENFPAASTALEGHLLTCPIWPLCQSRRVLGRWLGVVGRF